MGEPLVDPRSGEVLVSAADGYGYVAPAEQGDFSGQQVGYPKVRVGALLCLCSRGLLRTISSQV